MPDRAPTRRIETAEGLKIGFYHSVIDWHHPDFPVDGLHPQRDDLAYREANADRDISRYADYLHAQVHELLTHYGEVSMLWFDFSYPQHDWGWSQGKGAKDWRAEELLATVRELQPGILVNNRLGVDGNFVTPEQVQPLSWPEVDGERVVWEACQTLNGAWGYVRDNTAWKSPELLVHLLIDTVSKGGNMLLNVGSDARGLWPAETVTRLREVGAWLRLHERAIRGCTASSFVPPPDARLTQNGDRLYLHLFAWPMSYAYLENLAGRVRYAQFLHDASEVRFHEISGGMSEHDHMSTSAPPGTLRLELPARRPATLVPVIEVFLTSP